MHTVSTLQLKLTSRVFLISALAGKDSRAIAFLHNSTLFSSPFRSPSGISPIELNFSNYISTGPIISSRNSGEQRRLSTASDCSLAKAVEKKKKAIQSTTLNIEQLRSEQE